MLALAISSCTEDTTTLGNSLTSEVDKFTIIPDTFDVQTRSIKIDSVLSRSEYSYLGRVKDPETSSYITSDYMTQFHILENEASAIFPPKSSIVNHDQNNEPVADSCFINVIVNAFQGDSLTAMKLTLCELDKPVSDKGLYYTDFDPEAKGYLRPYKNESGELTGAVRVNRVYSLTDMTQNDSVRNLLRDGSRYMYPSPSTSHTRTRLARNTTTTAPICSAPTTSTRSISRTLPPSHATYAQASTLRAATDWD